MKAEPARGREAVEDALIEATCDLLSEVGPRATSVRDIASRAGVNHGQVHHYFGGKRALLKEAMRRMARYYYEAIKELSGGQVIPPPLASPDDQRYLKALVRATIEGDVDLARTEIEEGVSVSRGVLEFLTQRRGLTEPPLDLKVALAEGTAMQLGWMALEPLLFLVADVKPEEEDEVRETIRRIAYAKRVPVERSDRPEA
jgi:AcrR family transcriptional regulator